MHVIFTPHSLLPPTPFHPPIHHDLSASANDYESFPQRRGPESDLYGSTSSPGNGIYDNGMGQRQMKHSDDGIYDNGLGKSQLHFTKPILCMSYCTDLVA